MQILSTPQGNVRSLPPTPELIRSLHSLLPFGLLSPDQPGEHYGIVMQCGQDELLAVKLQPPDAEEQTAKLIYQRKVILIAHALKRYAQNGFGGLLMPCGYMRTKETGVSESGIACFGFPVNGGSETLEGTGGPETPLTRNSVKDPPRC